jgi:predicted neutral ceramidase superfamily lipid hydrolase
MKNKGWLTLAGFVLFFTGILSIVLSMIGVNFAIFSFLVKSSGLLAFALYLVLMLVGLMMVIVANTNLKNDEELVQ